MPRRNRVTPLGAIVADPSREALVFGNRGGLHDDQGRIRRPFAGRRWIACRLEFKGRRRELMQPGRYTELFFLDEATAFAAGHRPCAECRRVDFIRFAAHWEAGTRADEIDGRLHAERLTDARVQRHHAAPLDDLPDGAFVVLDGAPWLVHGDRLRRWTASGYAEALARPAGATARVVTPPSLVAVLRAGWAPATVALLHPTAR